MMARPFLMSELYEFRWSRCHRFSKSCVLGTCTFLTQQCLRIELSLVGSWICSLQKPSFDLDGGSCCPP